MTVAAGAFLQISGGGPNTETIGSLAGAGTTTIDSDSTLATGGNNASTTYTGTLTEGAGIGSLDKGGHRHVHSEQQPHVHGSDDGERRRRCG